MAKSIHSMIRVLDEARSKTFYQKAFNLSVADRLDFETFTLLYLSNAEASALLRYSNVKVSKSSLSATERLKAF